MQVEKNGAGSKYARYIDLDCMVPRIFQKNSQTVFDKLMHPLSFPPPTLRKKSQVI